MKRTVLAAALMMISCSVTAVRAAEPYQTAGKVDAATVYRGQALVTRVIEVPGPAGLREIVVTDLPEHVVPASLFAERADGVEIRSVRYRQRPVMEDVRKEIAELNDVIRKLEDELQTKTTIRPAAEVNLQYLDRLSNFVAATATAEMSKDVLNPKNVAELSEFIFNQRRQIIQEQIVKLDLEIRDLKEKIAHYKRQWEHLAGSSARTVREAVVFANIGGEKGGKFKLQYLVNNATWSPSYNVRAGGDRKQVLVEYNASIQQMSGEDWTDVAMTLSTATPSLVAKAPELETLTVTLGAMQPQQPVRFEEAKSKLLRQRGQLENERAMNAPLGPGMMGPGMMGPGMGGPAMDQQQGVQQRAVVGVKQFDDSLNTLAKELQVLEFASRGKLREAKPVQKADEGVSVTYALTGRNSLPSRDDQQLIQIAAIPVPAEFYRLASPVLTDFVYEEAKVKNDGKLVLLAGPVITYLNGEFVGHGSISTVSVGEDFVLGFGIDSSLRAKRELVDKKEEIQGGNRLVTFNYKLTVENFGTSPADIRLFDRLPVVKGADIKVTLISTSPEVAEQSKTGILRWDVTVPAQALADKALTVNYEIHMEYDKQMTIIGLPAEGR